MLTHAQALEHMLGCMPLVDLKAVLRSLRLCPYGNRACVTDNLLRAYASADKDQRRLVYASVRSSFVTATPADAVIKVVEPEFDAVADTLTPIVPVDVLWPARAPLSTPLLAAANDVAAQPCKKARRR